MKADPAVSIVVVVYNIPREAPRTLYSLSAAYQRHVAGDDYEVIVVDNGSTPPVDESFVATFGENFRLIRIDEASPSPAAAVNRGISAARGELIGVMIDGARMVTPGLVHFARHGSSLHAEAVVVALGWYVGYDFQRFAIGSGYNAASEDALLASIGWPEDGYRLFDIATPDECSGEGWLQPLGEANALFLRRRLWDCLGGMDERFSSPGGGLVNPDTYRRAIELPGAQLVLLLGEATFHQVHGGVATNAPLEQQQQNFCRWDNQYQDLRGRPFDLLLREQPPIYVGTLPRSALLHFARAAVAPMRCESLPLGPEFDQRLWSLQARSTPTDPVVADLVALAQSEFLKGHFSETAYLARLGRMRAPAEPEPQRLLALTAAALALENPVSADFAYAAGEAHRLLGEDQLAESYYKQALAEDRNFWRAHIGLAQLRLPGELYYRWLERLYRVLAPRVLLEIGVADGASLALAQPPTMAIGVDPSLSISHPLHTETHLFSETSDEFFARRRLDRILAGQEVNVCFIDGLHLYEQALRDFMHVEQYCGDRSVVLFHDTLPLDEPTQRRARETQFHTGDVWKLVLCLKHYRPDLDIFTVATAWTGLTIVTGLDNRSSTLADNYDEAVSRFIDLPFGEVASDLPRQVELVPNDWEVVQSRLARRGVLHLHSMNSAPMPFAAFNDLGSASTLPYTASTTLESDDRHQVDAGVGRS